MVMSKISLSPQPSSFVDEHLSNSGDKEKLVGNQKILIYILHPENIERRNARKEKLKHAAVSLNSYKN